MSWDGGHDAPYPAGGFGDQGGYPNGPPYGGPGGYGSFGGGPFGPGGQGPCGPYGPGQFGPCGPNAEGVNWIPGNPGCEPPHDAVKAKDDTYVIRARVEGDIIPGKWVLGNGMAYVPFGGREVEVTQFEILCIPKSSCKWVKADKGDIPPGAVQGGMTSSGEALFIAKGEVNDEKCIGKVHPSHGCAYFPWGGKEHKEKKYKVLCLQ